MSKIKEIWKRVIVPCYLTKRDPAKKMKKSIEGVNKEIVFPWSIYGNNLDYRKYIKDFEKIHKTWKWKVLYPIVRLSELILPEHQVKGGFEKEWHNKYFLAAERAYYKTIEDWVRVFIASAYPEKFRKNKEKEVQKYLKRRKIKLMYRIWRLIRVILKNDTAYSEFMNILLLNTTLEMNKVLKGKKEIDHLLYASSSINDIHYYVLGKEVDSGRIVLREVAQNGKTTRKNKG